MVGVVVPVSIFILKYKGAVGFQAQMVRRLGLVLGQISQEWHPSPVTLASAKFHAFILFPVGLKRLLAFYF